MPTKERDNFPGVVYLQALTGHATRVVYPQVSAAVALRRGHQGMSTRDCNEKGQPGT